MTEYLKAALKGIIIAASASCLLVGCGDEDSISGVSADDDGANNVGDGGGFGEEDASCAPFCGDDGIDDSLFPAIAVEPESITFDGIAPGEETDVPLIIRNSGTSVLTISKITLDDSLKQDFKLSQEGVVALRVNPEEMREIRVIFSPRDAEDDRGFLTIYSDATNGVSDGMGSFTTSVKIASRYVGLPAIELIYPEDKIDEDGRLNFGYVEPAKTTFLPVKIRNVGSGNAVLDFYPFEFETDLTYRAFRVEPSIPEPLSNYGTSGKEAEILIHFEPLNREGAFTDTITLRSNAPGEPPTIRVVGTSMKEGRLIVDRSSLDFGQVVWGETRNRHLFITNAGGQKIRFTKIALAAVAGTANLFDFKIAQPVNGINDLKDLRPGQTEEIVIEYKPSNPGDNEGELQLAYDDGSNRGALSIQDVRIPMKGTGINPEIFASPDELIFGTLTMDVQEEVQYVELTNPGTGSITVNNIYLDQSSSKWFNMISLLPAFPFSVDKNTPNKFGVRFKPEGEGDFTGKVVIETNDPKNPELFVSLFGRGATCENACPLPNAEQKCTQTGCEIKKCIGDFMDLDKEVMNGCECPIAKEMRANDLCPAATELPMQKGTNWGPITVEGQIVEAGDEDWYYITVYDDSWFASEVGIKVTFLRDSNADLWYCVYFAEAEGTGKVCPPDAINGTRGNNCVGASGSNTYQLSEFISIFSGGVRANAFIRVFSPNPNTPRLTCGSYFVSVQGY
ncbi:MAG: hypothetical protein Kow0090_17280 [Myxococcota bacterium]